MQGSVGPRQVRAVPPLCFYKGRWPNPLSPGLRLALFPVSRCSSFSPPPSSPPPGRSDWGCLLHISFGLAFPLHKAAVNVFCVQGGGDGMFSGGPTAACIGGSSSLGLALCVPWKDMKSQLFRLSQAAGLFFLFGWGVWGGEEEERSCKAVLPNWRQRFAEGSCMQVCTLREIPHPSQSPLTCPLRFLPRNFIFSCLVSRKTPGSEDVS